MVRVSSNPSLLVLVAAVAALAAAPALAASSASSASSEGSSASSGSVSDSFGSSSDSSATDKVAEGDYKLLRVAAAPQAGKLALTLRMEGADGAAAREFVLLVPEATVQAAALAEGDTVSATSRSFGWEFAAGAGKQAFFLVLHDEHRREFANRKVEA
jgi:hypothetical protein